LASIFAVGVRARAAASTSQMSSLFVSTAVTASGWPPTSTTSNTHAEWPPADAETCRLLDASVVFFFALTSLPSAISASLRFASASPRRGPNTTRFSVASVIRPSLSPWPIDS
jgi:hypothetical protein